jgi:hypothetical protein
MSNQYYKITRFYLATGKKKVIKRCLTLREAEEHCLNSESSYRTCKLVAGEKRTKKLGPWEDRYDVDDR